jgi:hypothetical protein
MTRRANLCHQCGEKATYHEVYDLYFCPTCDLWTTEFCKCRSEHVCPFPEAPARPSLGKPNPGP